MSEILYQYQNGQTFVTLYSDGTKVRDVSAGHIAQWPESIDVKITNYCDARCEYCHEMSTDKGSHGDLTKVLPLLLELPAGAEVAIGGGNALAHPGFEYFVKTLSEANIICNVTVNEFHFERYLSFIEDMIANGYIKGVGYSYVSKPCDWEYEHLVTHLIVGVADYHKLDDIVRTNKKVLLLGFKKNTGRGKVFNIANGNSIDKNIYTWYKYLFDAAKQASLSFDNLAITQLKPSRVFSDDRDYDQFFMGDDGKYSMYIDAVRQEYARSSTAVDRTKYTEHDSMAKIFSLI